jgi:hypothetical protein
VAVALKASLGQERSNFLFEKLDSILFRSEGEDARAKSEQQSYPQCEHELRAEVNRDRAERQGSGLDTRKKVSANTTKF